MTGSGAIVLSDPRSDARKPLTPEARWGQVTTPEAIARSMACQLFRERPEKPVLVLDPCVGPSTFPRALMSTGVLRPGDKLTLVDIDKKMVDRAYKWAEEAGLDATAKCADYIGTPFAAGYDYAILNPPYVRQEWLEVKDDYIRWFEGRYSLQVPGTSNLYVYFIIKVLKELRAGGQMACIVYDSWQYTRFGKWLVGVLERECDRITIETETEQPFRERLIDATVIYARKSIVSKSGVEKPRLLDTCLRASPLSSIKGFCALTDVFETRRGLRLKQADFFLCDSRTRAKLGATPFVKKVGKCEGYEVSPNHPEAALLLTTGEEKLPVRMELERRLLEALKYPQDNISILTWFRERPESWMLHRQAPYANLIFNYYIRNRPKHILNSSLPYSDNFYGLSIQGAVPAVAWLAVLNSTAACVEVLSRARNQGSGLAKIQLFEYRNVKIPNLENCSSQEVRMFEQLGRELLHDRASDDTIRCIDELIGSVFQDTRLGLSTLYDTFAEVDQKARKPREAIA